MGEEGTSHPVPVPNLYSDRHNTKTATTIFPYLFDLHACRFFKVAREYAPTIPSFLKEAEELFNKSYCNHLLPSFFPQYDVPQFWFSRRKLDFSNKKLYCRAEKNKWQIKSRAFANGYFALSSGAEGLAGRFFSPFLSPPLTSLRTADAFPVVASLPAK